MLHVTFQKKRALKKNLICAMMIGLKHLKYHRQPLKKYITWYKLLSNDVRKIGYNILLTKLWAGWFTAYSKMAEKSSNRYLYRAIRNGWISCGQGNIPWRNRISNQQQDWKVGWSPRLLAARDKATHPSTENYSIRHPYVKATYGNRCCQRGKVPWPKH